MAAQVELLHNNLLEEQPLEVLVRARKMGAHATHRAPARRCRSLSYAGVHRTKWARWGCHKTFHPLLDVFVHSTPAQKREAHCGEFRDENAKRSSPMSAGQIHDWLPRLGQHSQDFAAWGTRIG